MPVLLLSLIYKYKIEWNVFIVYFYMEMFLSLAMRFELLFETMIQFSENDSKIDIYE